MKVTSHCQQNFPHNLLHRPTALRHVCLEIPQFLVIYFCSRAEAISASIGPLMMCSTVRPNILREIFHRAWCRAAFWLRILITRDALSAPHLMPQWSESAAAATAPPLPFLNCFLARARETTIQINSRAPFHYGFFSQKPNGNSGAAGSRDGRVA